jgi:AcrR family transcriptional regulator
MGKKEIRKAEQRERQKNEILDVALKMFAAKSYDGASMNEIAAESGYSVGHIYNVVGSKEALFDEVMIRESAALTEQLTGVIDSCRDGDARACINRLVDATLTFFDGRRDFFQIYINETSGKHCQIERRFCARLIEMKKFLDDTIASLFRKAISEKSVGDYDADDLVIVFSELINGFMSNWASRGYPGNISEKSDVIKRILWNGIQRN